MQASTSNVSIASRFKLNLPLDRQMIAAASDMAGPEPQLTVGITPARAAFQRDDPEDSPLAEARRGS